MYGDQDFQKCLNMSSQTLLIEGLPGVGKSCLLHGLIQQTIETGRTLCPTVVSYTFNSKQSPSVRKFLLTLLRQIWKQNENTSHDCMQKLKADFAKPQVKSERIVATITEAINGAESNTCFFIDALDECEAIILNRMMDHLFSIQGSTGMGLVMTTRLGCVASLNHRENITRRTFNADDNDIQYWIEAAYKRMAREEGTKRPWLERVNAIHIRNEIKRTSKGM